MSECISSAPNNKGAIQYTHLFLCISSGRRLTNFSMRSLYFQINLHPSLCPLTSHSVWCHRPDVHFNAAFYVELSKLEPLTINDLSISFDLYSRQLQSSSLLGIAKLPLNQKETLQKGKKPITYFYHQDPVDLIDPYTPTPVGNIFITIALGYEDQLNLIEPQTRFIQVHITPIDKKNTKYQSPSNWMKAAHKHGWMSIEEIEGNWMEIAKSNGWTPYQKNENLTLETFKPINILKEYEAPPTADLLTIQPDSNVHSLFKEPEIVKHELFQPEQIIEILPQPKIKFKNKIKKPITVMDFFPRLSYSTKYENNEKSDSDFDQLIGKYLKTNSSTTLKSFPKQKRTKSAFYYNKKSISQKSSNKDQKVTENSQNQTIERSSSQSFDTKKTNNFFSQSESFELDSNNNFFNMLNTNESDDINSNSKNDQNQFKNSNNSNKNKKYDLDEKEWSSDFFSDSPDAASNQLDLGLDADSQDNRKIDKGRVALSLEEIVEREMEKLSKNSKKPNQPQNSESEDSNKAIQLNEDSFKIQNSLSENLNEDSQKVKNSKPVFFSPPPSLTQVIQKIDKKGEHEFTKSSHLSKQKVANSKSSIDEFKTKVENLNVDNGDDFIENKGNDESHLNYSILDDEQPAKKPHKKKRHTKSAQQQNIYNSYATENDEIQQNQEDNFQDDSKSRTFSNTIEKTTIKKRKLNSQSPPKRPKNRGSFVNDEEINSSSFSIDTHKKKRFYTSNLNDTDEITSPTNRPYDTAQNAQNFSEKSGNAMEDNALADEYYDQDRSYFTSPTTQILNEFTNKSSAFSAPSHRRRHNEDDPIQPIMPYRDSNEQIEDQIDTQKVHTSKGRSSQAPAQASLQKHRRRKRKPHQADSELPFDDPPANEGETLDGDAARYAALGGFDCADNEGGQRFFAQSEEEEQFTSPKVQFSQENRQETNYSAPRHHHRKRHSGGMEDRDGGYIQSFQSKNGYEEERPNINSIDYQRPKCASRSGRTQRAPRNADDSSDAEFGQLMTRGQFMSAMSPPRLAQTQRITIPAVTASTMQPPGSDDLDSGQPPFSEKVQPSKRARRSPEVRQQAPSSNPPRTSHARQFLPGADIDQSLFDDHLSSEKNRSKPASSNRSFIPTSRSMVDQKTTRRRNGANSSMSLHSEDDTKNSAQLPPQLHSNRHTSSFVEPAATETALKKRTKRSSLVRSNSPKPPARYDSLYGAGDADYQRGVNENDSFSKTIVVHSPTKAKFESRISPQVIDFSSTSPLQPTAVRASLQASHKKKIVNRQPPDDITSQPSNSPARKKVVRAMKGRNSNDREQAKAKGEISLADSPPPTNRKRSSAMKSPTRREKKVPKKPMDIKPESTFGPGPLSPATPNAQKKGIRMSPSLERMINGIDKLETSFDMSGIGSDSDDE